MITQIVEKALKDLYEVVQMKTNILKADRIELARQYKEIQFMAEYLKAQADGADPLEFLKLAQGHDLLKLEVCKQQTILNDIEIEISVNQQLQIKSDKTIKSMSLEDTQNEKQLTINKVTSSIQDKKATTGVRRRLFGRKDMEVGGPGNFGGLTQKIPNIPRNLNPSEISASIAFDKANIMAQREKQGLGAPIKQSKEMQGRIEKMF